MGEEAYSFDGSDDLVEISDNESLSIDGEITITAWTKPDNLGINQHRVISWKGGGWGRKGWFMSFREEKVRWQLGDGSNEAYTEFSGNLTAGEWNFVVARWKNGKMNVWINGEKSPESLEWSDGAYSSNSPHLIGGGIDDSGNRSMNYKGLISELRIYERALTKQEIQYLYNVGKRGLQTTAKKTS